MGPIYLFDLASQQARWLTARQAAVAGNIANANTPGFRPTDVEPFSEVLDKTALTLVATEPGHMTDGTANVRAEKVKKAGSWETYHSGNSVSLEQEMLKANEVDRGYSLNVAIVKAFHGMLLASVRTSG